MKTKLKYFYLDDFEHRLLVGCLTETLKASDQMEWLRRMNAVRETATEIVNNNLIYA